MLFWIASLFFFSCFYIWLSLWVIRPPLSWPRLPVKCLFLFSRIYVCGSWMLYLWWIPLFYFATFPIPSSSDVCWRLSSFSIHTAAPETMRRRHCSLLTALWAVGWHPTSLRSSRCQCLASWGAVPSSCSRHQITQHCAGFQGPLCISICTS